MHHRLELWRCMTYAPGTFTRFSNEVLFVLEDRKLNTAAIGDREVEAIWKQICKSHFIKSPVLEESFR